VGLFAVHELKDCVCQIQEREIFQVSSGVEERHFWKGGGVREVGWEMESNVGVSLFGRRLCCIGWWEVESGG
jgi:hypothetical protein